MFTSTTLPRKLRVLVRDDLAREVGEAKRNGSDGSFTRVCSAGSVGSPISFARAVSARTAISSSYPSVVAELEQTGQKQKSPESVEPSGPGTAETVRALD
jgi:hypothetical protein